MGTKPLMMKTPAKFAEPCLFDTTKAFCTRRKRFSHDEEVARYVGERHGDIAIDNEDACQFAKPCLFDTPKAFFHLPTAFCRR